MKSFQPTFPWAENTNHDNIVKLIETLGLTDTDVVIRLEDLEGLRAALQDFASRPNILNEVAELEDEVEYLKDELRSFENESAYRERRRVLAQASSTSRRLLEQRLLVHRQAEGHDSSSARHAQDGWAIIDHDRDREEAEPVGGEHLLHHDRLEVVRLSG